MLPPRSPRGDSGFGRSRIRGNLGLRGWLAFDVHDIGRFRFGSHFRVWRRLPVKLVSENNGHLLALALGLDLGRPNRLLHWGREQFFTLSPGGNDLRLDLVDGSLWSHLSPGPHRTVEMFLERVLGILGRPEVVEASQSVGAGCRYRCRLNCLLSSRED